MNKTFISARDLLRDSFRLAAAIFDSGFRPDFIIGIWRGGTPVGIAIQEYFQFAGAETDHIAVRTSAYRRMGEPASQIRVHGLHYVIEEANAQDQMLIVDDVFDSGHSVEALIQELEAKMRQNLPGTIKLAMPWYKPSNNQTSMVPDYYLHQTEDWLVFPHELEGLSLDEIRAGKPELAEVFELFEQCRD